VLFPISIKPLVSSLVSNNGVAFSPHNQWVIDLLEVTAVVGVAGVWGVTGATVAVAGVVSVDVLVGAAVDDAVDGTVVGDVVVSVAVLGGRVVSKTCACAVMAM
jgi:hypothetical protein